MKIVEAMPSLLRQAVASIDSHRHWLLLSCLLGAAGNALLFYFVPQPGYDHDVNLLAAGVFSGLALAVPCHRAYAWIAHAALLTALVLMSYITANTGGLHSPAMIWMTVLSVPAMLLLGRRPALFWVLLIVLVMLAQFVAVLQGWISRDVNASPQIALWALLDKVLVMVSLMLALKFYDQMHRRQMHELELDNTQLETTQRALRQAQSHKDEFIAAVGHELRTPMNAILGLNDVLQSELADQPDNARMAVYIREATEQLLGLVNDILDLSQLEAGRLTLLARPLALAPTLQQVVATFEPRAKAKSLDLRLLMDPQLPGSVVLDAPRLIQVLRNLLDNAIKFTARGQVLLRAQVAQGRLRFEVQDSGCGIAPEHQQQVFDRFEHADVQTRRAYGGTGLGLAICERLIKLQGGQIGVQSAPEQGALFWFELPLHESSESADAACAVSPGQQAPQRLRFLLVDDNAVNLMVARLMLEKCWPDALVDTAQSGSEALVWLEAHAVDVVFMDMVMPEMDGLETTRRLRQHVRPAVAQLPVLGLTANTHAQDRERCLLAGMDDVLTKPLDAVAVRAVVERLARRPNHRGMTP